jgi:type III restriction enzyme
MLKEGWHVRNVTVIVGLRAYAAKSNILPEQTLGRGLRRMYFGTDQRETVSVMGTPAFMEFVESIQSEGVPSNASPWAAAAGRLAGGRGRHAESGQGHRGPRHRTAEAQPPLQSEFGTRRPRPHDLRQHAAAAQTLHARETREIVFKTMLEGDVSYGSARRRRPADWRSAVGFYARQLLRELRPVGGYDVLTAR